MTQKTKAQLDVFYADNVTRDITAGRLRDLVDSCVPSRGTLAYVSALTAIAGASTPVKAANVTTLDAENRFTMPAINRLRYDGVAPVTAHVEAAIGASTAAVLPQLVTVGLAKNGVFDATTASTLLLGGGDEMSNVSIVADVDLVATDYLELWVSNETSDEDITIDHGRMRAIAFLS